MNYFVFILGREQKIALFELESVLRRFDVCFDILSLQDNIAIIKTEKASSFQLLAARLMENLGGTVKIYEIIQNSKVKNQNYGIESLLLDKLLENKSGGTLNFGISDYSNTFSERELKKLGIEIKKEARKVRPVRFVEGKGTELSSATSYHKIYKTEGEEFGIFRIANNQETIINKMTNVQYPIYNEISNSKTKECYPDLVEESQNRVSGEKYEFGQENTKDYSLLATNYLLGRLVATTNPDEWSDRDYDKPAGDKYSGMMPPKLARMMVNIALDPKNSNTETLNSKQIHNPKSTIQNNLEFQNLNLDIVPHFDGIPPEAAISDLEFCASNLRPLVVDPFCGSGNILMEAVLLGCEVIGSDISEKAVEDTRANLIWLSQNSKFKIQNLKFNLNSKLKIENFVFKADATSADFIRELKNRRTKEQKNIVVVTEPYLGKPKKFKDQKSKIKDEITELKSLYLSFFNNLKLLSTHYSLLAITFVFPIIETLDAGEISLYNECVDELRQMGYNPQCTLRYGRDYQVVKRQIVVITMEKS
jgi:tRNA G10  N-methylase Trm11